MPLWSGEVRESYASLSRGITLTAGTFQHLYSEVQACHVSRKKKRRAVCIFLYECDIHSLSFDRFWTESWFVTKRKRENNNDCHHRGDPPPKKEQWIVLNAVKFCLETSGRCFIIFHPFSKEGKKIKWRQTPGGRFSSFLLTYSI